MKTCSHCQTPKEPSEFHRNRCRPDGLQDNCKVCMSEAHKKVGPDGLTSIQRWKQKVGPDGLTNHQRSQDNVGPDGLTSVQRWNLKNPERVRGYQLKAKYNMTAEQFNAMLVEQGNACAICRDPDKKWCVDHDHATGKVRSILCYCCNIAIGNLGDSARLATAVAEYLTRHGKP